jgi:hypothetical protein
MIHKSLARESLMSRMQNCLVAVIVLAVLPASSLGADAAICDDFFEGRRITFVVPYQAGGGYDAYSRAFATVMETKTDAQVRVRNMTGAGGMIGIQAIADARPESLTLGIVNPISLIDSEQFGLNLPSPDQMVMLGSFIMDTAVGVALSDFDLLRPDDGIRVVGVVDTELVRTLLVTEALAWDTRFVRGYRGSSDRWLALLRGDIDTLFGTTESLGNYLRSAPEAIAYLSLTDSPNSSYPDIPYLAGEGGFIDLATKNLAASERASRMHLADLAVQLGVKPRAIAVTSRISSDSRVCLTEAVEEILFGDELPSVLVPRGLDVQPATSAQTEASVTRVMELMRENTELLDSLTEGL